MAPKRRVTYSSRPNHAARSAHARSDKMFRTYDTSAIRPKKSKAPVVIFVIILLAIVLALGFFISSLFKPADSQKILPPGQPIEIVVNEGDGANAIAATLYDAQLIESVEGFTKRVTAQDAETQLKPGTYMIPTGSSNDEIISMLKAGPGMQGNILTIPEGYRLESVAAAVESATNGRISADNFITAASDASRFASEFSFLAEAQSNSLEGFLFPKTYSIAETATADDIIRMLLNQYKIEFATLNLDYPHNAGLSDYEILKLASIIEKEATADTRETVASVFYNRLEIDMPLQSDATTAYEVGHDPSWEETHMESTYSTYTNMGLPPTPICSPGLASLQAACNPEITDYLYFYFEPDSQGVMQYYFNETYDGHREASE